MAVSAGHVYVSDDDDDDLHERARVTDLGRVV